MYVYMYIWYVFSLFYINVKKAEGDDSYVLPWREQHLLYSWLEIHWMCWLKIYGWQCIYQVHSWCSRTEFIQPSYRLYHKIIGLCLISLIQLLNWNNVSDLKYVMHVLSVFSGKDYFKRDYKSQCHMLCWQEVTVEIITQPQNPMFF